MTGKQPNKAISLKGHFKVPCVSFKPVSLDLERKSPMSTQLIEKAEIGLKKKERHTN